MATKSVLSNVDLIRAFVFEHQPVTVEEIVAEVRRQMSSVKDDAAARDRYVLPVLKSQPYYRQEGSKWFVARDLMPEYAVLHEVFRDEHRLLYEREVRSKVAKKLGVKVHTVVLDLEQAPGLKLHGSHWGLADWVIANDQAAEVLAQHPSGLNEKDLVKAISERFGMEPENTILHLKGDKKKRFVQERKLLFLKELHEKQKEQVPEQTLTLPDLKAGEIDLALEGSFLQSQATRAEPTREDEAPSKARLKKALKKQAQELLEQRESGGSQDDLAARLSQVLTAAGVDEYGVQSFQRVEPATRERSLASKERDEIQVFIDKLLAQDTVGVGAPLASVVNAPLSARKMQDVLRLKYINYTRDRAVIPLEYYRFLAEVLGPTINDSMLHPACFEGCLTVELLNFLFDRLEGAAWTMVDDESGIEIVQPDGARYRLSTQDTALTESARDNFMVTQVDLIRHYLNYKYTGIEADEVLASAARIVARLSGYEDTYIVSRDYLSELPEIFNHPPNDANAISDRFDFVIGNLTFTQDANLAANYLDQSLSLLADGGRLGVFVLVELMRLLRQHSLLGEFLQGMGVTHYIRLPVIEGRHEVLMLLVKSLEPDEQPPAIIKAQINDFKSANNLSNALRKGTGAGELYELVDQFAMTTIID